MKLVLDFNKSLMKLINKVKRKTKSKQKMTVLKLTSNLEFQDTTTKKNENVSFAKCVYK